jgi:serine/threonine protein kinase
MEALSPRSTNVKLQPLKMGNPAGKNPATMKAEIKKPAKEHAPPPPSEVVEPFQDDGSPTTTYLSGKLLGKGGFAVCYEGKNKKSNQVYALKVVKSKMSQQRMADKVCDLDAGFCPLSNSLQFRTELQIHAKMHHPNIVNFFRAFTYQESTYVVLELCENGSVMDMVKRRKCLSLPEVRRLTVQLCGAVKYMHQRNVIHRDLKMGNLFLDSHMNIKVGDFGLAAILIDDKEARKYRKLEKIRRTTMCGTPNYIAPEILEKQKNGHGHKVDIWAVGVIW